jgi:hypothetical protein
MTSYTMKAEQLVRRAVVDYLRKRGHTVYPHDTRARMMKNGMFAKFNPYYATKGEADLQVFPKSSPISPIWIELKRPGKHKLDPDQVLQRAKVIELGHEYIVVDGIEDCKKYGL